MNTSISSEILWSRDNIYPAVYRDNIKDLKIALYYKYGHSGVADGNYGTGTKLEELLNRFQKDNGLAQSKNITPQAFRMITEEYNTAHNISSPTVGTLGATTTAQTSGLIYPETGTKEDIPVHLYPDDPKYKTFFGAQNTQRDRQNYFNVYIMLDKNNPDSYRVVKNAFIRSVGVQIDSSGNPVNEVYEFIAQDVFDTQNQFLEHYAPAQE